MKKRIQASMRTRQSMSDLIEGHLSSPDACADLVKLATRLIVEEVLEAESRDALGREYYEHGAKPGQVYRNGHRLRAQPNGRPQKGTGPELRGGKRHQKALGRYAPQKIIQHLQDLTPRFVFIQEIQDFLVDFA